MADRPVIHVVGLGPAGPDLVTAGTLAVLDRVPTRFLRTSRHPAAEVVAGATSFDHVYERAATLDEVYPAIVDALVEAAVGHGEVVYAVPGSPVVAETTVALLAGRGDVDVVIHPALSFLELAWTRLGVDPVAEGARLVDGHRFAVEAAGQRGPLLVAQCDSVDVLSEVKLALAEAADLAGGLGDDEIEVTVLARLGLPDESVATIPWVDLDRVVEADHLTSVWLPAAAPPVAGEVARLAELVSVLRDRCPWDAEQTHGSLRRYLREEAEETIEVLDAVAAAEEAGTEPDAATVDALADELGDVLLQVVLHAELAGRAGWFTLADVARGNHDKMVRRHPHVFGDVVAETAEDVAANWEAIKRGEAVASDGSAADDGT